MSKVSCSTALSAHGLGPFSHIRPLLLRLNCSYARLPGAYAASMLQDADSVRHSKGTQDVIAPAWGGTVAPKQDFRSHKADADA
jgi:hypothetical protein